jgi:hypothetical protein
MSSTYTDVTGRQVDAYFLGRRLEQQAAAETTKTTDDTTGR